MSVIQELMAKSPGAVKAYPWLKWLLKAYSITDDYIERDLKDRATSGKPMPPCTAGCYECCLKNEIVLSNLELRGLSWFVSEVLEGAPRTAVRKQLLEYVPDQLATEATPCPFLVNGMCAVYPVRPLTCRVFYKMGDRCVPGERLSEDPRDFLQFHKSMYVKGATAVLQGMDCGTARECKTLAESGTLVSMVQPMQQLLLSRLVQTMDAYQQEDT